MDVPQYDPASAAEVSAVYCGVCGGRDRSGDFRRDGGVAERSNGDRLRDFAWVSGSEKLPRSGNGQRPVVSTLHQLAGPLNAALESFMGDDMPRLTPQVADLLDKALALSIDERGLLIDRLVESLDDVPADAGVEAAWTEEIKRRVDEIRSGKVKMIPGEQVLREMADEFPDE